MKHLISTLSIILVILSLAFNFMSISYASEDDSVIPELEYTEEDLRLMASIIYCEAGNQCAAGKEAVGIVVMNRVDSSLFPGTIKEVLYQKGQFSPICDNDAAFFNKALRMYDREEIPESCIIAARAALEHEKYVIYEDEILDMSECLFFSRYVKGCLYEIQDHDFK